jgi:hypothetical protein
VASQEHPGIILRAILPHCREVVSQSRNIATGAF